MLKDYNRKSTYAELMIIKQGLLNIEPKRLESHLRDHKPYIGIIETQKDFAICVSLLLDSPKEGSNNYDYEHYVIKFRFQQDNIKDLVVN